MGKERRYWKKGFVEKCCEIQMKLWKLVEIVKVDRNCEILLKIVKASQNYEIW